MRPTPLKFRETGTDDIEAMFSVRALTRQNPISREGLAAMGITPESTAADMNSGKLKGCGCFYRGALVGFCNGDVTTGEVIVLAVLPDFEGNGIGSGLLKRVVRELRCAGFANPWLAASPDPGIRAHGFYRAQAWKPTGRVLDNGDEILQLKEAG